MKSVNNFSMNIVIKMGHKGSCIYYFDEKNKKLQRVNCDITAIKLKMFHEQIKDDEKNNNENDIDISQEMIDKMNEFSVLDTTGAGDAFASGFLSEWVPNTKANRKEQATLESCLQLGCSCGTITVSRVGACPTPIPFADVVRFKKCLAWLMQNAQKAK